jgi:hypothetical protein
VLDPKKGRRPASISYSITPRANRSADVQARAGDLFRSHVPGRSHDDPDGLGRVALSCIRGRQQLGDAEVEDLDAAIGPEKHVIGLEVTMDDPASVSGGETTGDVYRDGNRLVDRQTSVRETCPKRVALEALRDQERRTAVLADVVHREDVRVVEGPCQSCFVRKTADAPRIAREEREEHLDGDLATQTFVARAPDLAATTGTEQPKDGIGANTLARVECPSIAGDMLGQPVERRDRHELPGLVRGR